MRKSSITLIVMAIVAVVAAALADSGLIASAQNTNSSTMTQAESKPKARTGRRRARKSAATADASADMSAMPAARTGRCDPMQQDQTDLSGTYTGRVNYPEASLMGDATLTITGNSFTLTAGSTTQSGRLTAVTTCGYTGVTMMFGDTTTPDPRTAPAPLPAVSLRAKRMGNSVTLTSVPGETRSFSFGSGAGRPRTMHRTKRAVPPPPPTTPPEQ